MRVLGINAVFHDPAAALVVNGRIAAAAEEERFSRRKHGKRPVPFSAWELPELSAAWCLAVGGLDPTSLDAVAYSFDPRLCRDAESVGLADPWDWLRVEYASRAPQFLAEVLPGLDPEIVRFVPHHVAHAASAGLAAPPLAGDRAVLVLDGRGEVSSHLAGIYRGGRLEPLAAQELPHSLGLLYEELTRHLGFLHSSDEYKVMALASYGQPRHLGLLRELVRPTGDGGFVVERIDWSGLAKPRPADGELAEEHAGRRQRHVAVTAAAAVTALATGLRFAAGFRFAAGSRLAAPRRGGAGSGWGQRLLAGTALVAAGGWLAGTGRFAWERIAPGPRDRREVATMLVTSVLIPPLAVGHWLRGWWGARGQTRAPVIARAHGPASTTVPYQADARVPTPPTGADTSDTRAGRLMKGRR